MQHKLEGKLSIISLPSGRPPSSRSGGRWVRTCWSLSDQIVGFLFSPSNLSSSPVPLLTSVEGGGLSSVPGAPGIQRFLSSWCREVVRPSQRGTPLPDPAGHGEGFPTPAWPGRFAQVPSRGPSCSQRCRGSVRHRVPVSSRCFLGVAACS